MQLDIQFTAELFTPDSVPAVALIEAADFSYDPCSNAGKVTFSPDIRSELFIDLYGNSARRLRMPAGSTHVNYKATVTTEPIDDNSPASDDPDLLSVPGEVIAYTLPSRYCPSEQFVQVATDQFGHSRPGVERINDICRWIHGSVKYRYGCSTITTSAVETMIQRVGVCRDFAHLGISMCRALNIPARYVSGYCLDLKPQDLHAYFQAYLDGRWVNFDATSADPRPALVPVAHGRDAADCAWWTMFGPGSTLSMSVSVEPATNPQSAPANDGICLAA